MIYNFKTYSKYETTPSDEPEYLDRLRKVALKFVSQSSIHALLHKVFFGGGFDLIDKPLDDNNLSLFFALKNFVEPAINNAGLELLEKCKSMAQVKDLRLFGVYGSKHKMR